MSRNLRVVTKKKKQMLYSSTWLSLVGLNELDKVHGIDARRYGTRER